MKIVISVASYYPRKDGVQMVTQYIAEGLAKKGHNVTVITSKLEDNNIEEIYNGVKIFRVNAINRHFFHMGNKRDYREHILEKTKDSDILIAVCLQSYSADWILNILDEIKCKKILYMHGMHNFKWCNNDLRNLNNFFKKVARDIRWTSLYKLNKNKIRKFDKIIHLHKFDVAFKYFKNNKLGDCVVLENAVDDKFFLEDEDRIKYLPNKYMIMVANYDVRKNQAMCLKAFYESNTKDYALIFIGSKENNYYRYLEKYKETIGQHSMERKKYIY